MILNIINKLIADIFNLKNLHFFVIWLCILMQMLDWGQPYRFFAYLNIILVLIYSIAQARQNNLNIHKRLFFCLLFIPTTFIIMHFLAIGHVDYSKAIRRIVLATFLLLGLLQLAKVNSDFIKKNIFVFTLALLFIYTISQAIALWIFNRPYGTATNPHYLALFSAISLMLSLYFFFEIPAKKRFPIVVLIVLLGTFLLHSSSRPTWIGVIVSGLLALIFLKPLARKFAAFYIALILILLTSTNLGDFESRTQDLLTHVSTEERVVIWQDAWKMQLASSPTQWIIGHGLDSFKESFKPFSHYHLQKIDFNSPHNFALELLFISGIIGLLLSFLTIFLIYKNLLSALKWQSEYHHIYLFLMVVITSNFILVCITVPFFSGYNLNIIAVITGIVLFLKETSVKKVQ